MSFKTNVLIDGSGCHPCRNLAGTLKPAWIKAGGGKCVVPDTPFIRAGVRMRARTRAQVSVWKSIRNHVFAATGQYWRGFHGSGSVADRSYPEPKLKSME